jgi:hypothetical protein
MVWAALQSQPITISDATPDVVRPRHIKELADLVLAVISGRSAVPPPEYPVGELAEIVTLVRPTPVHDLRTTAHSPAPLTCPPHRDDDLRFRLHHFSQWLAYEYTETEPATIT